VDLPQSFLLVTKTDTVHKFVQSPLPLPYTSFRTFYLQYHIYGNYFIWQISITTTPGNFIVLIVTHVRRYGRTTICTTEVLGSDSRHYQMIYPPPKRQNRRWGSSSHRSGRRGVFNPLGFRLTHSPPLSAKVTKGSPYAFTAQKKLDKNASRLCNQRQI
jgi:hypothetical protein